jgi:hypothetical protein
MREARERKLRREQKDRDDKASLVSLPPSIPPKGVAPQQLRSSSSNSAMSDGPHVSLYGVDCSPPECSPAELFDLQQRTKQNEAWAKSIKGKLQLNITRTFTIRPPPIFITCMHMHACMHAHLPLFVVINQSEKTT